MAQNPISSFHPKFRPTGRGGAGPPSTAHEAERLAFAPPWGGTSSSDLRQVPASIIRLISLAAQ